MATREEILSKTTRRTKPRPSPVFGDLIIQELSRREWRHALEQSYTPPDDEGKRMTLIEPWSIARFAAGVIDDTGKPIFTEEQVRDFPNRDDLWNEVIAIANEISDLSDAGDDALEKK